MTLFFLIMQVDGHKIDLPSLQGIVVLNIPRYQTFQDSSILILN